MDRWNQWCTTANQRILYLRTGPMCTNCRLYSLYPDKHGGYIQILLPYSLHGTIACKTPQLHSPHYGHGYKESKVGKQVSFIQKKRLMKEWWEHSGADPLENRPDYGILCPSSWSSQDHNCPDGGKVVVAWPGWKKVADSLRHCLNSLQNSVPQGE